MRRLQAVQQKYSTAVSSLPTHSITKIDSWPCDQQELIGIQELLFTPGIHYVQSDSAATARDIVAQLVQACAPYCQSTTITMDIFTQEATLEELQRYFFQELITDLILIEKPVIPDKLFGIAARFAELYGEIYKIPIIYIM